MTLLEKFRNGDVRALARLISHVENRHDGYQEILSRVFPDSGHAYKIGLTGPPGAGKSTLVDRLTEQLVADGKKVGIIAVDPSSPFTGGAFLGDRIRMTDLIGQENVFIRSMATRGSSGGLAQATRDVNVLYDAFGFDYIMIETVGVGQVELDIVDASDTVVVALVPESGDVIQAMKAGLMEIANIFCLNKADRDGADRVITELNHLLQIKREKSEWSFPVTPTSAVKNEGIDLLKKSILQHEEFLKQSGLYKKHRKQQIKKEIIEHVRFMLTRKIETELAGTEFFDELLEDIFNRKSDPVNAAFDIYSRHYSKE
jgi:LAO/AO transport system kinase